MFAEFAAVPIGCAEEESDEWGWEEACGVLGLLYEEWFGDCSTATAASYCRSNSSSARMFRQYRSSSARLNIDRLLIICL